MSPSEDSLFVNLYLPGVVEAQLGRTAVHVEVKGEYPWEGEISLTIRLAPSTEFTLGLRVPGWSPPGGFLVDGYPVDLENGYAKLHRTWKDGDSVRVTVAMAPQPLSAHPLVNAASGRVAVRRGALIYCAESADLSCEPSELVLQEGVILSHHWKDRLGGYVELVAHATQVNLCDWDDALYQEEPKRTPADLKMIPYSHWANRGAGSMAVWLRR